MVLPPADVLICVRTVRMSFDFKERFIVEFVNRSSGGEERLRRQIWWAEQ